MMDTDKLQRAAELEAEAKRLRMDAFDNRPLPDFWRVGQKVRFLRSSDYAFTAGSVGEIVALRDEGRPARDYQVFYTAAIPGKHLWWTTPDDVELVEGSPIDAALAEGEEG